MGKKKLVFCDFINLIQVHNYMVSAHVCSFLTLIRHFRLPFYHCYNVHFTSFEIGREKDKEKEKNIR